MGLVCKFGSFIFITLETPLEVILFRTGTS